MLLPRNPGAKTTSWSCFVGTFLLMLALVPQLSLATEPASEAKADETLLLEVQVNGRSIGKIGEFTLRDGKLMARPEELRDLGFRVPNTLVSGHGGLIALSDLPGLTWSIDQKNQELHVTVTDAGLLPTLLQLDGIGTSGRPSRDRERHWRDAQLRLGRHVCRAVRLAALG